ncbi:MAG: methionyl-tRNA formyltransferase [Dehalococcoidales bacterium]|nr:methionyl-tRNA formyltransferase [Dehalococcoidales bacterium]
MRIALIGQAPFGAKVLERLVQEGEEIIGAFMPEGKRGDPMDESARKLNVKAFRAAAMKNPDTVSAYCALKPDLGVMAFVTDIVPAKILECPKLKTIQYHPSLLPLHRGGSAINWPIINGEKNTGITIFWPDKGIDTGPILLQKEVEIEPNDTVGSLYFDKLFPLGVDAIAEAVKLVKQGKAPHIKQDESRATYEGLCDDKVARIDWSQPAPKLYNFIRGTNPAPGAYTTLAGKKVRFFDSELLAEANKAIPGQVIEVTAAGIKIAAKNGAILVKRVQPEAAAKMNAVEYAQQANLGGGAVFGK